MEQLRLSRTCIRDTTFGELWGTCFKLPRDRQGKVYYVTSRDGQKIAFPVMEDGTVRRDQPRSFEAGRKVREVHVEHHDVRIRDYMVTNHDVKPYIGGHVRILSPNEEYMRQGDIEDIKILPDGAIRIQFAWVYEASTEPDPDPDDGFPIATKWVESEEAIYYRVHVLAEGLRPGGKGILHLATHDGNFTARHFLHLQPQGYHSNPTRESFAKGEQDRK